MSNDDLKYTVSGIGKSVLELLSQEAALPVVASIFTIAGFSHFFANCITLGDPYIWSVHIEDVLLLPFESINMISMQILFLLTLSASLHPLPRWLAVILLIFMCAGVIFYRRYVAHDSWNITAVMAAMILCVGILGRLGVISFIVKRPINLVFGLSSIVFLSYMAIAIFVPRDPPNATVEIANSAPLQFIYSLHDGVIVRTADGKSTMFVGWDKVEHVTFKGR